MIKIMTKNLHHIKSLSIFLYLVFGWSKLVDHKACYNEICEGQFALFYYQKSKRRNIYVIVLYYVYASWKF